MGTVHKARWARRGLVVAVKMLHAAVLSPAEFAAAAAQLEREAALMRAASEHGANRFVVAQHGLVRGAPTPLWREHLGPSFAAHASAGAGGGELCGLVMQWESGGSLADALHGSAGSAKPPTWRAGSPGTAERMLLLERVAEGVAMLHSAEPQMVMHGDLKSANVLLTAGGEPRLSDFGLSVSRAAGRSGGAPSLVPTESARAGGSYPYMAPEMYRRRTVAALTASPSTDVYALGTLAWEVLVDMRPWAGETEADRVVALRDGENLDFERLPGDAPAGLRALLESCLDADSSKRPTATKVREAIAAMRVAGIGAGAAEVCHHSAPMAAVSERSTAPAAPHLPGLGAADVPKQVQAHPPQPPEPQQLPNRLQRVKAALASGLAPGAEDLSLLSTVELGEYRRMLLETVRGQRDALTAQLAMRKRKTAASATPAPPRPSLIMGSGGGKGSGAAGHSRTKLEEEVTELTRLAALGKKALLSSFAEKAAHAQGMAGSPPGPGAGKPK
jgi:serine/threonine protein kinase